MADDFDLFGNPIETGRTEPGRPEHVPTQENIIFVMVLLAAGYQNKDIAETLGISQPTLRKHYFHLLKKRDVMHERLRTKLRVTQIQSAIAGNAAALNAALRTLDAVDVERSAKKIKARELPARAAPVQKLGKKEEQQLAAQNITGKFAPPTGPTLVVNNQ